MLKFRKPLLPKWWYWPAIYFAALIAVATMGTLSSWATPPSKPATAGENYEHNHQSIDEHSSIFFTVGAWVRDNHDPIEAIATVLLTIVTGILVWVAIRQFTTTRAQLRAYVFVTAGGIQAATKEGVPLAPPTPVRDLTKPVAIIRIENSGQTPAYKVQMFGRMDVVSWPIDEKELSALPYADKVSSSSLGPGAGTSKYETLKDDRLLSPPEENDLKLGKRAIVVHGEIRYRDCFGRKQWTTYRWFTGGAVGIRGVELAVHEEGNDASQRFSLRALCRRPKHSHRKQ